MAIKKNIDDPQQVLDFGCCEVSDQKTVKMPAKVGMVRLVHKKQSINKLILADKDKELLRRALRRIEHLTQ